jgi:hypothetical protein
LTSKLLISKHQQVQLLEAASVLVAMNPNEGMTTPPESTKDVPSDVESMSPAASGYSDQGERHSSADTTPPPTSEIFNFGGMPYRNKRLSSGSGFARSYQRDLAAAVELLSCSFGSNNGSRGTVTLPADAPPVPPLPAQYLDQATPLNNGFINSFPRRQTESYTRGSRAEMRRGSSDVKMDESADSGEDDFDMHSRARSEDEDDGVFGRMEE